MNGESGNRTQGSMAVVTRADGGKGHKKYHLLAGTFTACGRVPDRTSAIPAAQVAHTLRCKRCWL